MKTPLSQKPPANPSSCLIGPDWSQAYSSTNDWPGAQRRPIASGLGRSWGQCPRVWAEGEGWRPDQSWGAAKKWPFMLLPQRTVGPLKETGFKAEIHKFHLGSESLWRETNWLLFFVRVHCSSAAYKTWPSWTDVIIPGSGPLVRQNRFPPDSLYQKVMPGWGNGYPPRRQQPLLISTKRKNI